MRAPKYSEPGLRQPRNPEKKVISLLSRQYLNLLAKYPFGVVAKEVYEIDKAKEILD